jgi:hypothetical protein
VSNKDSHGLVVVAMKQIRIAHALMLRDTFVVPCSPSVSVDKVMFLSQLVPSGAFSWLAVGNMILL